MKMPAIIYKHPSHKWKCPQSRKTPAIIYKTPQSQMEMPTVNENAINNIKRPSHKWKRPQSMKTPTELNIKHAHSKVIHHNKLKKPPQKGRTPTAR
jgi:hypothetical protein